MKPLIVVAILAFGLLAAHAQSADDRYLGIYGLMQKADDLAQTGQPGEALAAYTDAENQLQQFQKGYPNWSPNIVNFRLKQIAGKISELKGQLPPPAKAAAAEKKTAAANAAPAGAQANAELTAQLSQLQAHLQAELAANEQLQAKLKEALSVQPAAVDPRELEKAQERIRTLMKENDLLRASHGVGQTVTKTIYMTNTVTVLVTNNPVEVTNLAAVFEKNPQPVVFTNYVQILVQDTNAMEMLRLSREAAVKNFNAEHDRAERLANELERLRRASATAAGAAAGAVVG